MKIITGGYGYRETAPAVRQQLKKMADREATAAQGLEFTAAFDRQCGLT